jgi:hypothetical protein
VERTGSGLRYLGGVVQARFALIGRDYPAPVVDHAVARRIGLELYARAKSG